MAFRRVSLADCLLGIASAVILLSLLTPQLARYRAAARATSCSENLKQLALAIHNYHAAYDRLPFGSGGTSAGSDEHPLAGNAGRLSGWVGLTPFFEEQALWEKIANPYRDGGTSYPAMGPVPWLSPDDYKPWGERPTSLVCPVDPAAENFKRAASYVFNYGDGIYDVGAPWLRELAPYSDDIISKRGAFVREYQFGFRDFIDGTSNTLLISEAMIAGPRVAKSIVGLPLNPSLGITAHDNPATQYWPAGRDACWADGSLRSVGFQSILPPNSLSATSDKGELEAVMSASSHHAGGVHVVFADARVRFITNSIDTGDTQAPSVAGVKGTKPPYAVPDSKSPYGLWGAFGTRGSREGVNRNDPNIVDSPKDWSKEELAEAQSRSLQTWTFADEKTEIKASLIEISRASIAVLLTNSGEVKNVPLSQLRSQDAYRAVKQDMELKRLFYQQPASQLADGVKLLEANKIAEFIAEFLPAELSSSPNADAIRTVIEAQRDRWILIFDTAIRKLESPAPTQSVKLDNSEKRMLIDLQLEGMKPPTLSLEQIGNRWRVTQ